MTERRLKVINTEIIDGGLAVDVWFAEDDDGGPDEAGKITLVLQDDGVTLTSQETFVVTGMYHDSDGSTTIDLAAAAFDGRPIEEQVADTG